MAIAIRGTTPATTATAGDPTSLTLTTTRQPQANDVLIIVHCNDFYALSNIPTPTVAGSTTGVTSIASADGGTNEGHAKAFYYVVGSTGDLTVAVDETGSADEEKALIVYVLSGVDTASPIDVSQPGTDAGGDTSIVAPAVSPTSSDAFLICHVSGSPSNWGAMTPPSGMTETYDATLGGSLTYSGAVLQLSASGSTGTKTFTSANLANIGVALSIAVKTASAATVYPRPPVVAPSAAAASAAVF